MHTANRLHRESSPYLLQHAHNPVDWFPWCEEAWEKARNENKLVLISIGYSACHWCHVMERESFENEEVARIMNEHFVCIKVDREERPDVDQVYMTAVQIMTGSGGWPLNCFTLPDARPIYGGTYFPRDQWEKVLFSLSSFYKNEPDKVFQYASELTEALNKADAPSSENGRMLNKESLALCYENWKKRFDQNEGGPNRVPKFMLPNNYLFLLRWAQTLEEWEKNSLLRHVNLTLTKMAYGGINDQLGGGFARYSTDGYWKVPHFEKMLYDNAQMVSLYSEAYQATQNPLYRQVVDGTLEFIERELTSPEGVFYSALDADSEGEEGKYYVWTQDELQEILEEDFSFFAECYNVSEIGYWEDDHYILLRKQSDEELSGRFGLSVEEFQSKLARLKKKLLTVREQRVHPGLDNKILTSWNAMMIKGYADAYKVFRERKFLDSALKAANYLENNLKRPDGGLSHSKGIIGFLEDHSFTIEAWIALYECTHDAQWLKKARTLAEYAIENFLDNETGLFYFTSKKDPALVARKMEIQDNVIPSSNSSMAHGLFRLGKYFDLPNWAQMSRDMTGKVQEQLPAYGSAYSNWGMLMLHFLYPFREIAIVGNSVDEIQKELSGHYIPNAIFVFSAFSAGKAHDIPLLEHKGSEGKTLIYVCENKTCQSPVSTVSEMLSLLQR